jgi:hypothetical protein
METISGSSVPTRRSSRHLQLRKFAGILGVAIVACLPATSFADEGGLSFWLPGIYGSLAAAPQQPGWSFAAINYYTSVSGSGAVGAAREATIGKFNPAAKVDLNVNLHANADLVLLNPSYVFAMPVLGSQANSYLALTRGQCCSLTVVMTPIGLDALFANMAHGRISHQKEIGQRRYASVRIFTGFATWSSGSSIRSSTVGA